MEDQESPIEATPEALSKLESRKQEIEAELEAMGKRKVGLEKELRQIHSSVTDTRYAIDLLANPEKLSAEVAEWKQKTEAFIVSINLESVKENPWIVADLFSSQSEYWQNGQKLLDRAKKFKNDDLIAQIHATLKSINEKSKEVHNNDEYGELIQGVSWER